MVYLVPELKVLTSILLIFIIFHEVFKLIPVFFVQIIIDSLIANPDFTSNLPQLIGIFVALFLMVLLTAKSLHFVATRAAKIQTKLLRRTYDKLLSLPLKYHVKNNSGAQVSKITKAIRYAADLLWFCNNDIVPTIVQIVLTAIVLFFIKWEIGIVFLVFTPIIILTVNRTFQEVQPYREKYHDAMDKATAELSQSLINIQTVKAFANESFESSSQKDILKEYEKYTQMRASYETKSIIFRDSFTVFVRTCSIAMGVYYVMVGSLTVGSLVLLITLLEKAYLNIYRLGTVYSFMGDTYEGLANLRTILEQTTDLTEGTKKPGKKDIIVKNVFFAYEKTTVLSDISLTFPVNKRVAIIGKSGSGKTTLAKLLTRQYDPTKGNIFIGDITLPECKLESLRKKILYVSQHTEIFDRTIEENIKYGLKNATSKQVMDVAKKASAHEFIQSLPQGYKTLVGERGIKLSGGQQQRISIARALLANPDVIIFDETTSSLDTENEQIIQESIFSIRDKTIIIIAHRLSTIKHADIIIVMDEGKVVEVGSHSDLLKKGSIYNKMVELQKIGELRE